VERLQEVGSQAKNCRVDDPKVIGAPPIEVKLACSFRVELE